MKLFGIIFSLVALIFISIGAALAWNQHHKITSYLPVTATVLSKTIESHTSTDSDGHTSTTYKPIVMYEYEVNGMKYKCGTVQPIDMSSGHGWAQEIINKFTKGQKVEVFYDPEDPNSAFILKEYSFFPYVFILFPMIFLSIGLGVLISSGASETKPPLPVGSDKGWYEVRPRKRIVDRKKAAFLATLLWFGIGGTACFHYFASASSPYGAFSVIATLIYSAVGLVPLLLLVYYILLGRNVSDAQVFVNGQQFAPGEEITVALRQSIFKSMLVQDASIGLVCKVATKVKHGSKTTYSSHTEYEESEIVLENHNAGVGEQLEITRMVTMPESANPSTLTKVYPRYMWSISVVIRLEGSPDYKSQFPVIVL